MVMMLGVLVLVVVMVLMVEVMRFVVMRVIMGNEMLTVFEMLDWRRF